MESLRSHGSLRVGCEALEFLRLYPVVAKRCEANDKKSRRVSTQYA